MAEPDGILYDGFVEHRVKTGETLASIAEKNGLTWRDVARFNFGTDVPADVNRCLHEFTGCTKRTADGKNYVFTDADEPGIIYIPKSSDRLTLATGKRHRIRTKRPVLYGRADLETVDELGHRAGDVDLILRSVDGLPDVSLHTNAKGYGSVTKIRAGRYRVFRANGEPTYLFEAAQTDGRPGSADELQEAIIDTRHQARAITRVVVARDASPEERKQRGLLRKVYERKAEPTTFAGRGDETSGDSRRSGRYCHDNLALAAGWTAKFKDLNLKALSGTVMRGFLKDYHPKALARGYCVLVLTPTTRVLVVMSSQGQEEGRFEVLEEVTTRGLLGAYAVFEQVSRTTFVDMATMRQVVEVPGNDDMVSIEAITSDPQRVQALLDRHASEVKILYYAPTAQQLGYLGLMGGTGRLEDYGHDQEVNRSIHERNLAVCQSIKTCYDAYLSQYIEKVEKTTDEDALRKLGPPRAPYEMPTPAGATDEQMTGIFNSINSSEFRAWVAIAHQLDRFANRLSQGYPFLRIKPKFVATPKNINKIKNYLRPGLPDISEKIPVEVEFEMNIDIQLVDGEFEVVTKGDALIKGKVKLDGVVKKLTKRGVPVEVAYKKSLGNPEKQVVTVKISKFQVEMDTVGKTKLSVQAADGVWLDSEMNTRSGMFGIGVTLKGKDLAPKMRGRSKFLDKWADRVEGVEVQVQVGLVGTREETILAVVSNAPGFFERRSLDELFGKDTHWVDLTLDEQHNLAALGWYAAIWDSKYHVDKDKLPTSVSKRRDELSDIEKVAIVHLGFYAYEDYRKLIDQAVGRFSDYDY